MLCGAKSSSTGKPCKRHSMPNGKCKHHGGMTPVTNQNAVKHGFYSKCYTDEEQNDLDSIEIGTLAAELRLAKTQLRRAASVKEFVEGSTTTRNEHYRPDVIERLLNVVGRLEKQHAEISVDDPQGEFNQEDEFL